MIGAAILTMIIVSIPVKGQGGSTILTIHGFSYAVPFIIISLMMSWEGSFTITVD
jgi:hypothetical protein